MACHVHDDGWITSEFRLTALHVALLIVADSVVIKQIIQLPGNRTNRLVHSRQLLKPNSTHLNLGLSSHRSHSKR